jgi:hypothetical protein
MRVMDLPPKRGSCARAALVGLALASAGFTRDARAADDAGISAKVPEDAPTGRIVRFGPRRPPRAAHACSFAQAVCVWGNVGDETLVLATLGSAERALAILRGPLRMVPPDGNLDEGTFDLVLSDMAEGVEAEVVLGDLDPRSPLDRAAGYVVLSRKLRPGCSLDVAVARAVTRGVLLRTAPGTDEGSAQAEAQAVAELVEPCAPVRASAAYTSFQEHPERALVSRTAFEVGHRFEALREPPFDESREATQAMGTALFYRWLERGFAREPGSLLRGLFALRAAKTPPGAIRFVNEPDAFDVLGKSFRDKLFDGSTLDDLLVDFSLSRARFGVAAEGGAAAALSGVPRARVDWDVPYPSAPRRLAPAYPVEPTGVSYVVVRTAGLREGARLRIEASWEEHARMRVAFVRLDAASNELGRARVAAPPMAHEAQMTIADLAGTDRLVVAVVALGDPSFHFDPDDVVHEPHGYALTIAPE